MPYDQKISSGYNVLSLRVTDEEKAALEEVARRNRTSVSQIMREAVQLYSRELELTSSAS